MDRKSKVSLNLSLPKPAITVLFSFALIACQNQTPSMTLEDAKKIKADFNITQFKPDVKDLADIKAAFTHIGASGKDCRLKRLERSQISQIKLNNLASPRANKNQAILSVISDIKDTAVTLRALPVSA